MSQKSLMSLDPCLVPLRYSIAKTMKQASKKDVKKRLKLFAKEKPKKGSIADKVLTRLQAGETRLSGLPHCNVSNAVTVLSCMGYLITSEIKSGVKEYKLFDFDIDMRPLLWARA